MSANMRRTLSLCGRSALEILRDPLNLLFGLGFPLALLCLLHAIQLRAPVPLFELQHLTPGIAVFGLSFMALFSATLVSKDRGSAFLQRLYASPLTPLDFILGYTLPLLPLCLMQTLVCYACACLLGLPLSGGLWLASLSSLPSGLFFVALGLFCGSLLTDKQVGGLCGALLTNLTAWLSGAWFAPSLAGGAFEKIASALPFLHAVEWARALLGGGGGALHGLITCLYAALALLLAVWAFLYQMKRQ